ncbi:MAG: hypothetical protein ABEJ65_12425 [bacterium]
MVTQVITPHEMEVIVQEGEVEQAITDGKYNEMKAQYLQKSTKSSH